MSNNKWKYDYLLVGAGLYNGVFAYEAKKRGKKCLVIDKREHLGGNIYCSDVEGISVHLYGPHIFHTSNINIWNYVCSLSDFNHFTLNTLANYKGEIYNLPFNMNTFNKMWGVVTPEEAKKRLLDELKLFGNYKPSNLEEQALSLVGKEVYDKLIKGYTEKQWGRKCSELPPSIINRIPVRFTYNNNYFNDCYQGVPDGGYGRLINKLFNGIEYRTRCNYFDSKSYFDSLAEKVVYTGAIDEYFGYCFGCLEYRSLYMEHDIIPLVDYQGNAIVNYTSSDIPYTRIVEHKHFDINNNAIMNKNVTVITHEYPIKWNPDGEAFYPINDNRNNRLYEKYKSLAERESNVIFGGRLAEYKYLDMDEIIEHSLELCAKEFK